MTTPMTEEELDEARAREAARRLSLMHTPLEFARLAARLAREGWAPIDPDLIEAREVVATFWDDAGLTSDAAEVRAGREDKSTDVRLALAAIKRGRELALSKASQP